MNHFDQDESPDWDRSIETFEQQLRSVRPTPPERSWEATTETLESSSDLSAVVSAPAATSSWWSPVISHSLTAAIGVAIGIGMMLAQQSSDSAASDTVDPSELAIVDIEPAEDQPPRQKQPAVSAVENRALASQAKLNSWSGQSQTGSRSHRFYHVNLNHGPLTVSGPIDARLARDHDGLQHSRLDELDRDGNSDGDDKWLDSPERRPADRPVLSPRSLHLFLDDLTYVPDSDKPFFVAEDSRS